MSIKFKIIVVFCLVTIISFVPFAYKYFNTYNSDSPIVISATITGGGNCQKYCWYDIKVNHIFKNDTSIDLQRLDKLAVRNTKPQPSLDKSYTFELSYFYEDKPLESMQVDNFTE